MKICAAFLFVLAVAGTAMGKERTAHEQSAAKPAMAPLLSSELDGADMAFLKTTAESQAAQMALAELVKSRAQEPEIRTIAAALYEDGKKEREALAKLSGQKGLPLPAAITAKGAAKSLPKTLAQLKGPKFDKAAMDLMNKLENSRAATFQAGVASTDPDIQQFAAAHFPAVQESLLLIAKLSGVTQPKMEPPEPVAEPPASR